MRPEDFTADAPGAIIQIPRPLTTGELMTRTAGASSVTEYTFAFLPSPLPPDLTYDARLSSSLGRAMLALGRLDTMVRDLPNPRLLARPLLRREAVESSRIEGTVATLEELVAFEETHEVADQRRNDVREVANYARALEYGLAQPAGRRTSVGLFRELHHLLLDGVRGEQFEPGQVRTRQNFIGDYDQTIDQARYVPPPPSELPGLLTDLENYIASESDTPLLIRIALVHYQFEAIHPFLDGNGRVGRLLIALLLHRWRLITYPVLDLSAYVLRHRTSYVDGLLRVSQRGDWRNWLDYFLLAVEEQALDASRRTRQLLDLRTHYGDILRRESRSDRLNLLIDHLFEHGSLTITTASELLDVAFVTAQRLIRRLEHLGILEEVTGKRRDRVYNAREVIEILDDRRS